MDISSVSSVDAAVTQAQQAQIGSADEILDVSDEQRYRMIAEAAYYRAEQNNFNSDPLRDWVEAENDINALLTNLKK